jgi:flagellar biosynthetic protein FliP
MCLVMAAPFALLLPAFWLGLLSGTALMIAGHVVMFPLMAAVMLRRRGDYTQVGVR